GQLARIVLPQRIPALAVAWLIGLALATGDVSASILAVPPEAETLSIHIFNLAHYGVEDQVAGICLALTGTFAAAVMWLARQVKPVVQDPGYPGYSHADRWYSGPFTPLRS